MSPDCLLGVVTQPTDSRLSETINEVERKTSKVPDGQMDVMLVFLARLLGNNKTVPFLDSLELMLTVYLNILIELFIQLEHINEANITDEEILLIAHKRSTLSLVMLLYE